MAFPGKPIKTIDVPAPTKDPVIPDPMPERERESLPVKEPTPAREPEKVPA